MSSHVSKVQQLQANDGAFAALTEQGATTGIGFNRQGKSQGGVAEASLFFGVGHVLVFSVFVFGHGTSATLWHAAFVSLGATEYELSGYCERFNILKSDPRETFDGPGLFVFCRVFPFFLKNPLW